MEGPEGYRRDVAIKVLHDPEPAPAVLRRFRDEARILARLRDRAIVRSDAPVRIGEQWCLVMEYVDGASCAALIARGPVPVGVAIEIVGEVARALHSAHNLGGSGEDPSRLVHRDIKPENVQVTRAGEVKLLDFGIARVDFPEQESRSRTTGLPGTPGYIAPERLRGVDLPAGDVFSLGVVLHELVTGERARAAGPVGLDDEDPLALAGAREEGAAHALELGRRMRSPRPEERPTAREVERACRELRQALPAPWLHDWAEDHVPQRPSSPDDAQVGATRTAVGLAEDHVPASPRAGRVLGAGVALGVLVLALLAVFVPRPTTVPREPQPEPLVAVSVPTSTQPAPAAAVTASPAPGPSPVRAGGSPLQPAPTVEPAVPASATFEVMFASVPPGASVVLVETGEIVGTTPVRHRLEPGSYRVSMTTEDGLTSETTVMVGRRRPTRYVWKPAEDQEWVSGY